LTANGILFGAYLGIAIPPGQDSQRRVECACLSDHADRRDRAQDPRR
jgi:hypothetical protein